MKTETNHLADFKQSAIQAHNWTSFSPEKRGEQLINDYNEQLTEDLSELTAAGIDSENVESYKTRYIKFFSSWLSAKSRCASPMITGPANFNVRKHDKANRSEENHYKVFQEWRLRAKKAIIRKSQPVKTYSSEIERYKSELEGMKANHEKMKLGNKMIAKAIKNGADLTEYLTKEFNIQPHMIEWTMKFGFGLANNNANIKRVEQRIKELEAKEKAKEITGGEATIFSVFGATAICNYEADRVQIKTDSKPSQEIINTLKKNAFKWSPTNGCWQRQLTQNAIYITKHLKYTFAPELKNK